MSKRFFLKTLGACAGIGLASLTGFADSAALMAFHANNPDAPNKPVAVMMV